MKRYFIYELKKSLYATAALAVCACAIFLPTLITDLSEAVQEHIYIGSKHLNVPLLLTLGGIMALIVPMWKLSYRFKKRSVDMYFALPLTHTQILIVKLLTGLVSLFAAYTLTFALGAISTALMVSDQIRGGYFILMYLSTVIPLIIIYSLTAFLFSRANRFIDGFAFVFMGGFALFAVILAIRAFFPDIVPFLYTPYAPLDVVGSYFQDKIIKNTDYVGRGVAFKANMGVGLALTTLLAIGSATYLILGEKYVKAENCEQISSSVFGYKTLLPLWTMVLSYLSSQTLLLVTIVAASAYAVAVLYKRSVKIGWKEAVIIAAACILGISLFYVSEAVCAFYN